MRMHRLATLTVAAALAATAAPALAGPAGSGLLAPALAQRTSAGAGQASAAGGPPPPGGAFSHQVFSQITINQQGGGGGGGIASPYPGPPCWLEPRFTSNQSWQRGDPVALTSTGDADEYWWWFAAAEPDFAPGAHNPLADKEINDSFRKVQHSGPAGWWWVPSWLSGSAGVACAHALVSSLGLNNGFLQLTPPGTPEHGGNPGTIDGQILADMARAALVLPPIRVYTSPAAGHPTEVNLPVWVWVDYPGGRTASDSASVPVPGGQLTATVSTSRPKVTILPVGGARVYSHCGQAGTRYNGDPKAVPPCGVTFLAPSTNGPYSLTVQVSWRVRWRDNMGGGGVFQTPPWPAPLETKTTLVTVREIQTINTPPPTP